MTYKERAHALHYEWIMDKYGDICFRKMLFNDDGVRQVRFQPDPCEFVSAPLAICRLRNLEYEIASKLGQAK